MHWTPLFLAFVGLMGALFVGGRLAAWVAGLVTNRGDTSTAVGRASLAVPAILHSGPWALAASIGALYYAWNLSERSSFWAIMVGVTLAAVIQGVAIAINTSKPALPALQSRENIALIRRRFFWIITVIFGGVQASLLFYLLGSWTGENLLLACAVLAICLGGGYIFAWIVWQFYEAGLLSREEMRAQLEREAGAAALNSDEVAAAAGQRQNR
jgi:hypothetical protein